MDQKQILICSVEQEKKLSLQESIFWKIRTSYQHLNVLEFASEGLLSIPQKDAV